MTSSPSRGARIVAAAAIGLTSAAIAYLHLIYFERALAFDFTWPWRAAHVLLSGGNPYEVIRPTGVFPFDAYFKYPLPAALVAAPFARMSGPAAAASFGGVSAALLAYGLTDRHWGRLYLFLSAPFAVTLFSGQWSTLLMAGALLPGLSWVAACKPTVGLAVFAYRPNRWAVFGGILLMLASFLILPSWAGDWLRVLQISDLSQSYMAPVALTGGPILLLGLLRWRRPEARYLVAVSITPHILGGYAGFLPMLVAETRGETQLMALSSAMAQVGALLQLRDRPYGDLAPVFSGYWLLAFLFLPALVIVLRRPNEGPAPTWLNHAAARLPTWIGGIAT